MDSDVLAWHLSAPVSEDFLCQLMDLRFVIEPKASYWAAKRGGAGGLEQINQAQKRMEQEKGSLEDFIIATRVFTNRFSALRITTYCKRLRGLFFQPLSVRSASRTRILVRTKILYLFTVL